MKFPRKIKVKHPKPEKIKWEKLIFYKFLYIHLNYYSQI